MNDAGAMQLAQKEVKQTHLGRPRGSTGHQPERVKHQLASLVVVGTRNVVIAQKLGVSSKTVRLWLRHPAVQQEIKELDEEIRCGTERLLSGLFRASVRRLGKIIRKGESKVALHAIELLWSAHGRQGKDEGARYAPIVGHEPVFIQDDMDVRAAMELLKAERRRLERDKREDSGSQSGRRNPLGVPLIQGY